MDVVLGICDDLFFDRAYAYLLPYPPTPQSPQLANPNTTLASSLYATAPSYKPALPPVSALARDNIWRQSTSVFLIALVGAYALYFIFCALSYWLLFDKRLKHHPRYLKGQVWLEIKSSCIAVPTIDVLTLPWFMGEVRGHSKLYEDVGKYGWTYLAASVVMYLVFTDFLIYWIHRLEHHPRIYKYIHKPHHKWVGESTPFHPL